MIVRIGIHYGLEAGQTFCQKLVHIVSLTQTSHCETILMRNRAAPEMRNVRRANPSTSYRRKIASATAILIFETNSGGSP